MELDFCHSRRMAKMNGSNLFYQKPACEPLQFLVGIHVMRRPFWCTKQWKMAPHVLHNYNNGVKIPKDILQHCSAHQKGRRGRQMKTANSWWVEKKNSRREQLNLSYEFYFRLVTLFRSSITLSMHDIDHNVSPHNKRCM